MDAKEEIRQEPEPAGDQNGNAEPGNDGVQEPNGGGESGASAGATEPGSDYTMLVEKLNEIQADQASMALQIKALSDAQSVMVESGAVVREIPANQIDPSYSSSDDDDFVSIEDLDLSI